MKNFKLKKLVAVALTVMAIAAVSPIGASAAWRQDSKGWWNTEGNSWSTGWRSINGSWYDFGSDGYMKTGWVSDGGTWYFTAPSGEMKTGWVNDGGTWYFTAASGAMETGVVQVDGKVYYLAPSGEMETGAVTIDGITYTFAASGEATGDKIPTTTVAFTAAGTTATPVKPADTTTTTTPTTTTGSSSHGGGGGSSHSSSETTYVALSQAVIDAQYQAATKMTNPNNCSTDNADGTTTIKPKFGFIPEASHEELISATGKSYTVTKDVYVTLDGTDAFISGNYTDGYKIDGHGTVKIGASISVYDSATGKLYYVTPATTEKVVIS